MTAEQHRWHRIRVQAQAYLRSDFAKSIVRQAENQKKLDRREYVLMGLTAAVCLASVAITNWYVGNLIQQRNLARWGVAVSQIGAIRKSL